MNIHHWFWLEMVTLWGGRHSGEDNGDGSKRGSFLSEELHVLFPKLISSHMCVNLVSSHLSLGGKDSWNKSACGAWSSLCGLGQRWSHCKQPLALMMCSEPVEACKSAAGISLFLASNPPQPLRYLCQSYLRAPVSGSSVTMRDGDTAAGSTDGQKLLPQVVTSHQKNYE